MATISPGRLLSVKAQIEAVSKKIPEYYENSSEIAAKVKAANPQVITASSYLYRIPFIQTPPGVHHKVNMDGGALGNGSGMIIDSLQAGFIDTVNAFYITTATKDLTATEAQSRVDVFNRTLAYGMVGAMADADIALHQDGTGVLTNPASAASGSTITFADPTDRRTTNLLVQGKAVDIWDTTLAAKRAVNNSPVIIKDINFGTGLVTLSTPDGAAVTITALASTDRLAVADTDVVGTPATPTSFSSTWPGGGLTSAAGLTGDTYRHGYRYWNDATTSYYYLTKLKSSFPQLLAKAVNASGNLFYIGLMIQLIDQIYQSRSDAATKGLEALAHMKQIEQISQIAATISRWERGNGSSKMPDLVPSRDGLVINGVPIRRDKRQDRDRIDLLNFSNMFRVETHPIRFRELNGDKLFPAFNASGQLLSGEQFFIEESWDYGTYDPGAGGYIYGLGVPS